MKTIHQCSKEEWTLESHRLEGWREDHPSCPDQIAERIIATMRRAALRRSVRVGARRADTEAGQPTPHPSRIGAGAWAVACETVHRETGYSGGVVRSIVRALQAMSGGCGWEAWPSVCATIEALPPCPVDPTYWDRGYTEEFDRRMAANGPANNHVAQWVLYWQWHVERAIAEVALRGELARLVSDPTARISGYLAHSILLWGAGRKGYEGCSGCEWYALVRDRPDLLDYFLSRAPIGKRGPGWEQTYPHEYERIAACRMRGMVETLRLYDSLWTR